ncbi:MAG: FadR family transcriptional regulator [Bradyrhizobiaceae bacterium]|nr:FadR family transcriptional regulator [Bradyrhizobiaceae bacterium]
MIWNTSAPFRADAAEKVQRRNVYQLIADRLLTDIVENRLQPGTEIPTERELSERYGVGRSSVREGLRMLESQRIIEPGSDGQYRVGGKNNVMVAGIEMLVAMGEASLSEVQALRSLLEVEAAGLAAELRTDEDLAEIRASLREMIVSRADRIEAMEADLAFHVAIGRASKNGALAASIMAVRSVLRGLINNYSYDIDEAIFQHQLILEAIAGRNVKAARERISEHMHWISQLPPPVEGGTKIRARGKK